MVPWCADACIGGSGDRISIQPMINLETPQPRKSMQLMNRLDPLADVTQPKTPCDKTDLRDVSNRDGSSKQPIFRRALFHRIIRRFAIIPLVSVVGLYFLSMTAPTPTHLGVHNGKLAKCPSSPNCVSTQADNLEQQMPVIPFDGDPDETLERIKSMVQSGFPRAMLVSEFDHYLHFEFKSLIFRFVDDVEFFVDDKASVVHFRSASRVGHSDLGANRKRMKQISESLSK